MYLICVHVNSKYNKESKPYFLHALTRLFFVAYFSKNLSLSLLFSFFLLLVFHLDNESSLGFYQFVRGTKINQQTQFASSAGNLQRIALAFRYTTKAADGHPLSHERYVPFCLRDAYHDRICDSEHRKSIFFLLKQFWEVRYSLTEQVTNIVNKYMPMYFWKHVFTVDI